MTAAHITNDLTQVDGKDVTTQDINQMSLLDMSPSPLGMLGQLPREIRDMIYRQILTGSHEKTWGKDSGVSTSILCASNQIHVEAMMQLYNSPLVIPVCSETCTECPPSTALSQMVHLTIEVTFSTTNRGECERSLNNSGKLKCILEHIALSLRRSQHLRDLDIVLLNEAQRKRGPKPVRSDEVRDTIRGFLRPFAALHKGAEIRVSGFDTLEYLLMFDEMRLELAGSDIPVEELCELTTG